MTSLDRPALRESAGLTAVRINHADAVMDGLRGLVPSEWPALVFTSLAALSVPLFSDRCHILIEEDDLPTYRIERPITGTPAVGDEHHRLNRVRDSWSGQWVSDHAVQTSFTEKASATGVGFRGTVLHLWDPEYQLTGTDLALAQLMVDQAIALLRREQGRPGPADPDDE